MTALQVERPKDQPVRFPVQQRQEPVNIKRDSVITLPKTGVKDTTVTLPIKDMVVKQPPVRTDTMAVKPIATRAKLHPSGYMLDSTNKHFAMVILDKVDPLFVNEVKNAFYRYGRDRYYDQAFEYNVQELDADKKLLLIGYFPTAKEAVDFIQRAKPAATGEIMPWLKADKYTFSIITDENLGILLQKKDLVKYHEFLDQTLRLKN